MHCCCLGYSVGAGHFLSPATVEVVGGAPQYNQRGKVAPVPFCLYYYLYVCTSSKHLTSTWWEKFLCSILVFVCIVHVQVYIFTIENNHLRIVSDVAGEEVSSCLAIPFSVHRKSVTQQFVCVCVCLCSWDPTLAPVFVRWMWMQMVCQICWSVLHCQRAQSGRRGESMCTSIRGRWVHVRLYQSRTEWKDCYYVWLCPRLSLRWDKVCHC